MHSPEPDSAAALGVAQRARVHAALRAAVRAYELATMRHPDGTLRLKRFAASVALDLGLGAALQRSDRSLLAVRLPLDIIDTVVWGHDIPSPPETPTLIGVPLALEAGVRYRLAGLVVPAASWVGLAVARRGNRRGTPLTSVAWQALGVGTSWLLESYEGEQRKVSDAQAAEVAAARRSSAYLAGQNEVAMGADSVVDELGRIEHILATVSQPAAAPATGRALAAWKANLAEATEAETVYLGTFLARWERSHRQPDLSADVYLELPAGAGTTILTSTQAAWLTKAFDALAPRGSVTVDVAPDAQRVPGDAIRLLVGDVPVVVAADQERQLASVDARPVVVLTGFSWSMSSASRSHGHVPLRFALPASSLSLALAWWAQRGLDDRTVTEHQILLTSLAVAGIQAVIVAPHQRQLFNSDGLRHFPIQPNLMAPALLAATYRRRLTPGRIGQILAVASAAVGASLVAMEEPVPLRDFVLGMAWVAAAFFSVGRVQAEVEQANDRRAESQARSARLDLEQAWLDGRQSVLDLVFRSWLDAAERVAEGKAGPGQGLEDGLAQELERRLTAARIRLDGLRWEPDAP